MKHPYPFLIGWIIKGCKLMVTKVCKISFSIGNFYQDDITCDLVEMHACHFLLGRPWQHDVNVIYKGKDNNEFEWNGRKKQFLN